MTRRDVIAYYQQDDKTEKYHLDRFSTLGGKLVNTIENAIIQGFLGKATSNGRILDVGTGTGRVAMWFQSEKVGVDSSISMLKEAKRAGLNVICSDIKFLPFRTATFSAVVAVRVFIRVKSPLPLFKEVARVLRNGGLFVFDSSNKYSVGHFVNWLSQEPPHSVFSKIEMQRYLQRAAFKIVNIKPSFIVPRGVYQKTNRSSINKLYYFERLLLKTRLGQLACTFFWQTSFVKHLSK